MDNTQKPAADRIRPFLQAMERSIDSARQKRTSTSGPIRSQAAAPGATNPLSGHPHSLQIGRPAPPQPPIGTARPAYALPGAPAATHTANLGIVTSEPRPNETPGKLKARRKDADPLPHASFQPQRKAG